MFSLRDGNCVAHTVLNLKLIEALFFFVCLSPAGIFLVCHGFLPAVHVLGGLDDFEAPTRYASNNKNKTMKNTVVV